MINLVIPECCYRVSRSASPAIGSGGPSCCKRPLIGGFLRPPALREEHHLKPDAPIRYSLEIPDNAVAPNRDWLPEEFDKDVTSQYPEPRPGSLQECYNQILGKMAKTRPAASIGDDFQTLQDDLEERYNER